MIAQILADSGQIRDQRNVVPGEFGSRPDAREHQELRGVDGASGDDDLGSRPRLSLLRAHAIAYSHRAAAFDQDLASQRVGDDGEVGTSLRGAQIGRRGTGAPAAADGRLNARHPLLHRAVIVFGPGDASLGRSAHACFHQRIGKRRAGCLQRPAAAAISVAAAFPVFLFAKPRQHVGIGPAIEAGCGPSIVVARIAADIRHGIGRRAAPDHPAARAFDRAIVECRLGL